MSPRRPARPRRRTAPRRPFGWRGWLLLIGGLLALVLAVRDWLSGEPLMVPLVALGLALVLLAFVVRASSRPGDPNWTRTAGMSMPTLLMDAEDAEWEEMRRRKRERQLRRDERARAREERNDRS